MNFVEAVRALFANCFDYSGRDSRSEFWYAMLFAFLAGIACSMADLATGLEILAPLLNLVLLLPGISVQVRRLHDTGHTGWWVAANPGLALAVGAAFLVGGLALGFAALAIGGLVALGVGLALLIWYCDAGSDGFNDYGANPLEARAGRVARFA